MMYTAPVYKQYTGDFMGKLQAKCLICSKDFFYTTWDRNGKFCTRICFEKSRNKPIEIECIVCSKKFSFHKKYRVNNPCCSYSCGQRKRQNKEFEEFNNKSDNEKLQIFKERFERSVIKTDGCWDWKLAKEHGYGIVKIGRKQYRAHRLSWLIHNGPIPEGMFVLHKCLKNRQCTKPEHLYLGTALENNHDIMEAGDRKKFLTSDQVIEIRKLISLEVPCTKIAKKFNIGIGAIMDIKRKKTWRHL